MTYLITVEIEKDLLDQHPEWVSLIKQRVNAAVDGETPVDIVVSPTTQKGLYSVEVYPPHGVVGYRDEAMRDQLKEWAEWATDSLVYRAEKEAV